MTKLRVCGAFACAVVFATFMPGLFAQSGVDIPDVQPDWPKEKSKVRIAKFLTDDLQAVKEPPEDLKLLENVSSDALKQHLAAAENQKYILKCPDSGAQSSEERVPQIIIDCRESVWRGFYAIYFRYKLPEGSDVSFPVHFNLNVTGDAKEYIGHIPFVHESGFTDESYGVIFAFFSGKDAPISNTTSEIAIGMTWRPKSTNGDPHEATDPAKQDGQPGTRPGRQPRDDNPPERRKPEDEPGQRRTPQDPAADDGTGHERAKRQSLSAKATVEMIWEKSFDEIGYLDIKGYLSGATADSGAISSESVFKAIQSYKHEPAVLFVRTSANRYSKILFSTSGNAPGDFYLNVLEASTFYNSAKDKYSIYHQLGCGGFLPVGASFDLDGGWMNCEEDTSDFKLLALEGGGWFIQAQNGCVMRLYCPGGE